MKYFERIKKKYKGFTLVELLVVIAILAVLASVSVVGYLGFVEKARLSNDQQLVSQINNLIKAEDTYTYGTSNDALEIQNILKKQGISEVKTESKGNYIFFNNESRKAVLASLTDTGINVVYGEDSSSNSSISKLSTQSVNANFRVNSLEIKNTASAKQKGEFLDYIYAPESFVKGYTLITTESRDGFCQNIRNIRNGGGAQKNVNDAKTSITNSIQQVKNQSKTTGELLENMSKYTMFVNGEIGTGDQQVWFNGFKDVNVMLFGANITNINSSCFDNIDKLSLCLINFLSSVETIEEDAIKTLSESEAIENCVITYDSDELTNDIKNKANFTTNDEEKAKYEKVSNSIEKSESIDSLTKTVQVNYFNNFGGTARTEAYATKKFTVANKAKSIKIQPEVDVESLKNNSNDQMKSFEGYYIEDTQISGADGKYTLSGEVPSSISVYAKWNSSSTIIFNTFGCNSETEYSEINSNYDASVILALVNSDQISEIYDTKYDNYVIYPSGNYDVGIDLNIPSDVTFWVPYSTSFSEVSKFFEKAGGENEVFYGCLTSNSGTPIIKSGADVKEKTAKVTINFNSKVTNSGNIIVGAEVFASNSTNQRYSGSITENFGTLNISSTASLYNESGNIYVHGLLKNEGNENFVSYSGNIYEGMLIEDWPGGKNGKTVIDKNVSPFNQWELLYLQSSIIIKKSCNYYANIIVYVYQYFFNSSIRICGSEDSLFTLNDYDSYIEKKIENSTLNININGTVSDSKVIAVLKGETWLTKFVDMSIDFSTIPFPAYNMNINLMDDAVLTLNTNLYKLLPGSQINISEDSTLNISTSVALYDSFYRIGSSMSSVNKDFLNKNAAVINNYGTIIFNKKGIEFGGRIELKDKSKLIFNYSPIFYNDVRNESKLKGTFKECVDGLDARYFLCSICGNDDAEGIKNQAAGSGSNYIYSVNNKKKFNNLLTSNSINDNYYYGKNYTKIKIGNTWHVIKSTLDLEGLSGVTAIN